MWTGKGKAAMLIALAFVVFAPPTAVLWIIRGRRANQNSSPENDVSKGGDHDQTLSPSKLGEPLSDLSEKILDTSASPVEPLSGGIHMSQAPSNRPSKEIKKSSSSNAPTVSSKSVSPSKVPSKEGNVLVNATTFYAIADVPYSLIERVMLPIQLEAIPSDAEFVIHLGDIRKGSGRADCNSTEFASVAATLRLSRAPVFIVLGDNEWNDCPNIEEAWTLWNDHFGVFERHWNHAFNVYRPDDRKENFAFVHNRVLFIGLNLVGGSVHDALEWSTRLTHEAAWVKELVGNHTGGGESVPQANTVVIFGHAYPSEHHTEFFDPLHDYVQNDLDKDIAVLLMHGDGHYWLYEPNFLGQENFLRVQLTGGTIEPPLKVVVDSSKKGIATSDAFRYDRRL